MAKEVVEWVRENVIVAINKFKKNISKKLQIKKLILFGSYARGDYHEDSDVDLILVSPAFRRKKFVKRSWGFYKFWHLDPEINYPVDFICYTQEEFKKLKKCVSLVSMALEEGIEIN